jgi:hypothetical protein
VPSAALSLPPAMPTLQAPRVLSFLFCFKDCETCRGCSRGLCSRAPGHVGPCNCNKLQLTPPSQRVVETFVHPGPSEPLPGSRDSPWKREHHIRAMMDCLNEVSPPCLDTILILRARAHAARWGPPPQPPTPVATAPIGSLLPSPTARLPRAPCMHHSCPPVRFRPGIARTSRIARCPTLGSCPTLECATRKRHHDAAACLHEEHSGNCLVEECRLQAMRWMGFPCRHSTASGLSLYFIDHGFLTSEATLLTEIACRIIASHPAWTTEWSDNSLALSAHVHARLSSLSQERPHPMHSSPPRPRASSAQTSLGSRHAGHGGRPRPPVEITI